jgi:biopolymer transport protein ExbB
MTIRFDYNPASFFTAALISLALLNAPAPVQAQSQPAPSPVGQATLPGPGNAGNVNTTNTTNSTNSTNVAKAVQVNASPAASSGAASSANPYGLSALWSQGDWVARACLLLLTLMSIASWHVLASKLLELRRLKKQTAEAAGVFSDFKNFPARIAQLGAESPMRFLANAGSVAVQNYPAVRARVDFDTWLIRAIEQALSALQSRTQGGMAVLATIGSTAPFVGLFGTVWAIYTALVKIGASGQASIDRVAGPVGEALIMTAIGLAVAVPAVFGYNWLLRQNKLALDSVRGFGARLHVMLLATSEGVDGVKPAATKPDGQP